MEENFFVENMRQTFDEFGNDLDSEHWKEIEFGNAEETNLSNQIMKLKKKS
jgi:hypothetical protein